MRSSGSILQEEITSDNTCYVNRLYGDCVSVAGFAYPHQARYFHRDENIVLATEQNQCECGLCKRRFAQIRHSAAPLGIIFPSLIWGISTYGC